MTTRIMRRVGRGTTIGNLVMLLSLLIIGSACTGFSGRQIEKTPYVSNWHEVDPVFREFYDHVGGKDVLGYALSALKYEGQTQVQYVEAGKLVYDPKSSYLIKFHFAPLGVQMGVNEPAVPRPSDPGLRYVGGHIIYPDFLQLYEQIGARFAGKPLTEARYNPVRQRYEQYFENVGIFRSEGAAVDDVRLLAYGLWVCDDKCRSIDPRNAIVDITPYIINPVFESFVEEMGTDFTGFSMAEAEFGADDKLEQVFERMILILDASSPSGVSLRPLPEYLGILRDPPKAAAGTPGMYFYAEEGDDVGYEIPFPFWEYITQHGGLEIIGAPITHLTIDEEGNFRQCYQNLCLLYDWTAAGGARVHPEPLGYQYLMLIAKANPQPERAPEPGASDSQGISSQGISLQVLEKKTLVNPRDDYRLGAQVLEKGKPTSNMVPVLIITLPDGSKQSVVFPPTDANGMSYLKIPPIDGPNGQIISYQVCIPQRSGEIYCVGDSYMIWYTINQ